MWLFTIYMAVFIYIHHIYMAGFSIPCSWGWKKETGGWGAGCMMKKWEENRTDFFL